MTVVVVLFTGISAPLDPVVDAFHTGHFAWFIVNFVEGLITRYWMTEISLVP